MRIPARGAARGLTAVAVLALALTACGGTPATPTPFPTAATSSAPGPRVLVTGLEVPWGVAFLPDGAALVTERESARLLRVAPDGAVTPVGTVAGVVAQGEGGLLGVAVSPDFAADRTIVVAYTSAADNRVVRLRVAADGTVDGAAQQVLVSGIVKAGIHNGGAVTFGPDGLLYIGTGDAGRRAPAQDRADLGGKILRVTADGAPAPGNPFGTPVYSLGHRNVQGLAFAPDGTLYAAEFGQNRVDEINRITAGGNYGWPEVEGVGEAPGLHRSAGHVADRRCLPERARLRRRRAVRGGAARRAALARAGHGPRRRRHAGGVADRRVRAPARGGADRGRHGAVGDDEQPRRPRRPGTGRRPDPGGPAGPLIVRTPAPAPGLLGAGVTLRMRRSPWTICTVSEGAA